MTDRQAASDRGERRGAKDRYVCNAGCGHTGGHLNARVDERLLKYKVADVEQGGVIDEGEVEASHVLATAQDHRKSGAGGRYVHCLPRAAGEVGDANNDRVVGLRDDERRGVVAAGGAVAVTIKEFTVGVVETVGRAAERDGVGVGGEDASGAYKREAGVVRVQDDRAAHGAARRPGQRDVGCAERARLVVEVEGGRDDGTIERRLEARCGGHEARDSQFGGISDVDRKDILRKASVLIRGTKANLVRAFDFVVENRGGLELIADDREGGVVRASGSAHERVCEGLGAIGVVGCQRGDGVPRR